MEAEVVAVEVAAEEDVAAVTGPNSRVPLRTLLEKRLHLIKDNTVVYNTLWGYFI
jgi:hypothetical protein